MDNFPLDERVAYAQFYDGVDNNSQIRDSTRRAWADLDDFEDAHALSVAEARQVTHDIDEIRDGYRRIASNYNYNWKTDYVPAVHLRTDDAPPPDRAQREDIDAARATLCKPITAK